MIRLFARMHNWSKQIGFGLVNLLSPPVCHVCERSLANDSEILCPGCWDTFRAGLGGLYCPTCGQDAGPYSLIGDRCHRCLHQRTPMAGVVRVGVYRDNLRELILSLKFRKRGQLDRVLGTMLAQAILGNAELCKADWLVPIPLHWRRQMSRGYNQADLISRMAAVILNNNNVHIPISRDLVRVRHTPAQASLTRSQRLVNLRGAFAVRRGSPYQGCHICLIDDVITTGATLHEAAKILRKAGAAKVSAAVLAVAVND